MKYAYSTDVGKRRTNNEDAVFANNLDAEANVYIVADGMGGHNAGEVASKNVIQIVSSILNEQEAITQELIIKAIESANKSIFEMSKENKELSGMGTTVVVAVTAEKQFTIAHVGDSRAYLITKAGIQVLTMDHSWVQELINTGALTQSEAKDHPQKNVITRAIGIDKDVKVDVLQGEWNEGEILLLCSDGLNTHVEDNEIYDIISQSSDIEIAVAELIDLANNRGGSDNITVVLVENNLNGGINV